MTPSAELAARVEGALGRRVVDWNKPHTGLSAAERFVATLADGTSVFVKAAVDDDTERWLRTEHLMLTTVDPDLVPVVVAWLDENARPVLILEDLHDAHWPADHSPVRWNPGQIDLVLGALDRVAATPPPAVLAPLSDSHVGYWPGIGRDPAAFLSLGLCSAVWLHDNLEALTAAEAALDLRGDALVHHDVRSDNVCFRGDRVILVDWSDPRRGPDWFDRANFAQTLPLEGGPDPFDRMPEAAPFAAWRAGELATRAVQQAAEAPSWLIDVFKRLVAIDLAWAARAFDLTPPERPTA